MQISTKFRLLVIGFGSIALVLLMLFVKSAGDPTAVRRLRDIPAVQFYGMGAMILVLFVIMTKLLWWDLPRAGNSTKASAREIAQQKWYVKGASVWESATIHWLDEKGWCEIENKRRDVVEGGAVLRLSSTDANRVPMILPLRPGHPTIETLRTLRYLDVVEFDFVEKPLECALDIEYCAYLTLKTR